MKVLKTIISVFLFFVILAPVASADSTAFKIMKLYNTSLLEDTYLEAPPVVETDTTHTEKVSSTPVKRLTKVNYKYRIPRTSDIYSDRKGEVTSIYSRRAQQVYKQARQAKQEILDQKENRLKTYEDKEDQKEIRRPGLSPWFSLNWKNRLRAGFKAADAKEMTYKKPEIEAKRKVVPFNTSYRGRYNYQDSEMDGKRKLMRTLRTRSPWDSSNSTRVNNYWQQ